MQKRRPHLGGKTFPMQIRVQEEQYQKINLLADYRKVYAAPIIREALDLLFSQPAIKKELAAAVAASQQST